ncbi:MAG: long-chain fatty acid--CoA ligase [Steroidobacteraceae bacterium]
MLTGQMMTTPLTVTAVMRHAERVFPTTEIVSITAAGRHRYCLREAFARVRRLANVLQEFGLQPGARIATLAWNDHRHFEAYFAISCSGYVCHTVNPRLFPAQIEYILNHAEDEVLLVDAAFVPLVESLAAQLKSVRHFIVLAEEGAAFPPTRLPWLRYETLLAGAPSSFTFPQLHEEAACALAYTSGTTGDPKGVLYSHRSTVLHSFAICMPAAFGLSSHEVVLTAVPMFHVNAWSLPYAATLTGCKQVLPGSKMGDAAMLADLIHSEGVTLAAGVPTVWSSLLTHLRNTKMSVGRLDRIIVGGAACSSALAEGFEREFNVTVRHAWGMTEMSPLGTVNSAPRHADLKQKLKQGQPIFGVELKIVDSAGRELPWNGVSSGFLKVRGPWVCREYFRQPKSLAHDTSGWFETGDIATIDPQGCMQIVDRSKDIIKSGGEWISSIDLENAACAYPDVREAAVIGVPHAKWDERPVLYVVAHHGVMIAPHSLRECLSQRVASWWLPDAIIQVDSLPHTATGKLDKKALRAFHRASLQSETAVPQDK